MPRKNNTPPHQRFTFTSGHEGKRRFPTRDLAERAAEYQMTLKPELTLSAYQCPVCGGWHLTGRQKSHER